MSRIPPHSPDIERDLIASMLTSQTSVETALDTVTSEDFYLPKHKRIVAAISRLAIEGKPIDPGSVALEASLPVVELRELASQVPASMAVRHYASVVAEKAGFYRTIRYAESLKDAAYDENTEQVDRMLGDPLEAIFPNHEPASGPTEASALAAEDHQTDWKVENLLGTQEVVMWVGEPGFGKSTLLRQMAVCIASGLHPFERYPIEPKTVLMVDCQESRGQASLALRGLLDLAGQSYKGRLFIEPRPQGIDLTTRRHARWLDSLVAKVGADVVILGPLYNLIRGASGRSKQSEETAELGMNALSDLMVRRDCSLMIEAHAPHGDEMRVRGSKLWEDFPDFGFGLVPDKDYQDRAVDVRRFRGDRHSDRDWPARFVQGHRNSWPWEPAQATRRVA